MFWSWILVNCSAMGKHQTANQQPLVRIAPLLIIGTVICILGNQFLSLGQRVMSQVEAEAMGVTVGAEFWQNLPEDVRRLDEQIERQAALFESVATFHKDELIPPEDGSRTPEAQQRINDIIEAALAEPTRALRATQRARRIRIDELKAEYLARRSDS